MKINWDLVDNKNSGLHKEEEISNQIEAMASQGKSVYLSDVFDNADRGGHFITKVLDSHRQHDSESPVSQSRYKFRLVKTETGGTPKPNQTWKFPRGEKTHYRATDGRFHPLTTDQKNMYIRRFKETKDPRWDLIEWRHVRLDSDKCFDVSYEDGLNLLVNWSSKCQMMQMIDGSCKWCVEEVDDSPEQKGRRRGRKRNQGGTGPVSPDEMQSSHSTIDIDDDEAMAAVIAAEES